MSDTDQLWMDSYGFVYSADGKRLLKGANVEGAYWIPEGVEEIEPGALIGCRIGTLHVPWTLARRAGRLSSARVGLGR